MNYYIKKFKHKNGNKLRNMHDKNPKQYWKFLKKLKPKSKDDDTPQNFTIFLKILIKTPILMRKMIVFYPMIF
jgi:hypothetical protein